VNGLNYEHPLDFLAASPHRDGQADAVAPASYRSSNMTTIHMAPGAMVLKGTTHNGLERFTVGIGLLGRLLAAAVRGLDAWREARIAAHNDAMLAQLAASDPRVLADMRAALDRRQG
jgi:hypothetical protein